MNSDEWLLLNDPTEMLRMLPKVAATDRRLRLFATSSCRLFQDKFPGPHFSEALDAAERYAEAPEAVERFFEPWDLIATSATMQAVGQQAIFQAVYHAALMAQLPLDPDGWPEYVNLRETAATVVRLLFEYSRDNLSAGSISTVRTPGKEIPHLLRDIFSNPFRPITLDPRWRTADVLDLARAIYEDRAFDRMPILADALMDAGCDSAEVIGHCRGGGPHVRGCWVVDLTLGKE